MQNLAITWSEPVKIKNDWLKQALIPEDARAKFLRYWNKNNKYLIPSGFDIQTRENGELYIVEYLDNIESSRLELVKNSTPLPLKNKTKLREWQILAAEKLTSIVNSVGAAVEGSDMGVGKTYSAIAVARELNVPFAVVCPKAVKNQWQKVAIDHFQLDNKFLGVINYELLIRGRKDSFMCELVKDKKTNRKNIKWKLPKNTLIIYDEAHKLKNYSTKNSKFCIDAYKNKYKMLFLSATLAVNPVELRTIGTCLGWFKTANDYIAWLRKNGCSEGRWGWEFNNDPKVLKNINRLLFDSYGVRLKRDTIPNFPETEIIVNAYDLDEQKTNQINEVYKRMHVELSRLTDLKESSETELTIRLRNRQIVELLKTDLLVELANEGIDAGMSVIIFVNYSETLDVLSKALNTTCVFDGRLKEAVRKANLERFQQNLENPIIINIKAGSTGLNMPDLDGKHPRLVLISPDDDSRAIKQCLGRAVRENSKSKTLQKIVFANGTVEMKVIDNLSKKLDNMELINDGDLKL